MTTLKQMILMPVLNRRDQAIRILRDKTDIFEEGGNVIKLGPRHRFSVNTQRARSYYFTERR